MASARKQKYPTWRKTEREKPKGLARLRPRRWRFLLFRGAGTELIKQFRTDKSITDHIANQNKLFEQLNLWEKGVRSQYREWDRLSEKERQELEARGFSAGDVHRSIETQVDKTPRIKNGRRSYKGSASQLVSYRLILESMLAVASPEEFRKWSAEPKPKPTDMASIEQIREFEEPAFRIMAKHENLFANAAFDAWRSCEKRMAIEISRLHEGLGHLEAGHALNHFLRQENVEKIMQLRKMLKGLGVQEVE
ncbi:MAG: hypothetical protein NT067_04120 [Candidatus Diapherotrites archaeon]|nr:hypothetical protein [Candidatus Diapherotrites archaeon]